MDQFVVMAGSVLASVIGLGLLGLVLVTTIRNSQRSSGSKKPQTLPVIAENQNLGQLISPTTIRGFDTPELYREDDLARRGQAEDEQALH